ncbi:hypothetical protein CCACVL1_17672 [Corchorus capsularis]|uniref:F-box domain-containing protein n=1 Tax=Corchorus capsularis TaxID=210143 RepID=A0A1R3HQP7_COCAP|nr:hypothetical protein CCACVL1_17672 [Corchorus capsularis]
MAANTVENLPPPLDATAEQPPLFDGTTRLYTCYTCPFAQRVWITRNYKGLQDKIKLVPLNLQNRPAWYKEKVYPENKVPALEHNGKIIGESLDLIKYVDSNFERPSLLPEDPEKKKFFEELLSYLDQFLRIVYTSFMGSDHPKEAVDPVFDHLENALHKFDGPFFLGEFSLADIACIPFIERFQIFLSEVFQYDIVAGRPKLAAWIEEMNKLDAYKQTKLTDLKEFVAYYKQRFLLRALKTLFSLLCFSPFAFKLSFPSKTETKISKSKATMSDYLNLPQELLVDILVRLPIEDVVKSTAVCKSWNSLIKTPTFTSAHLQKTISFNNSTNTHHLLFRICPKESIFQERVEEKYSLRFDNEDVDEYKQLNLPRNVQSFMGCFRVAGSINGLVCLDDDMRSYMDTFFLWNPTIKKVVRVPEPGVTFDSHGGFDACTGFGFDSKTNDYKLLRFVELVDYAAPGKEPMVEAEIYSLNANCWTSITHIAPKYGLVLRTPKTYGNCFVNGAIHMLVGDKDRNLILAFDVSEEVFREIPLPECLSNYYLRLKCTELLTYGQSIAATTWDWDCRENHLWVMKEYGVAMSWTKVFTEVAESVPRVLFFRKEEGQVFVTVQGGWIASVDIKKKNKQYAEVFGVRAVDSSIGYPVIEGFVESLVLLDKVDACWDLDACGEDPQVDTKSVDDDSDEKGAPEVDESNEDPEVDEKGAPEVDESNEKGDPEVDASSVDDDLDEYFSADDDSNEHMSATSTSLQNVVDESAEGIPEENEDDSSYYEPNDASIESERAL